MRYVAFDTETHRIAVGAVYPPMVCGVFAEWDGQQVQCYGLERVRALPHLEALLRDDEVTLIGLNMQFDMIVPICAQPTLMALVMDKYAKGLIHDIRLREQLLNLSERGRIRTIKIAGKEQRVNYSLLDLERRYLGVDRIGDKQGDSWRLRYQEVDGWAFENYPEDAQRYALDDARNTLMVWYAQEQRGQREPHLSLATHEHQARKHFHLGLITAWGIAVDQSEVEVIKARLEEELAPEKHTLLYETGIRRPAEAPRPYANGARHPDGSPKMTAGKKESTNKKVLQNRVATLAETMGYSWVAHNAPTGPNELNLTKKGEISSAKAVLDSIAHYDPALQQFQHWQSLQKIATSFIEEVDHAGVIHANYDPLKETGRTSSYGGDLYPSLNIQQVPRKISGIEPRKVFVPRPGQVFCACDYSSLELVSWAQVCHNLGLEPRLRKIINAGVDPHGFLGGQVANTTNEDFRNWFPTVQQETHVDGVPESMLHQYDAFRALEDLSPDYYNTTRNISKAAGLGFAGGLGPRTLCIGPARMYGLYMEVPQAKQIQSIWKQTLPEAVQYFRIVENMTDPFNSAGWEEDEETGELTSTKKAYQYVSPLGMVRRGATFCAAANGTGLQTPSAEGAAGFALFKLSEACWRNPNDILYGCRIVAFIHDEFIVEMPDDNLMHERAHRISELMVDGMGLIMKDVRVEAEPVLTRRWLKGAKQVWHEGRLQIFEPQPTQAA